MSRSFAALRLGAAALVLSLVPLSAGASHIVVAGPVWYPTGMGTSEVNFVHTEVESTQCCGGAPAYSFGDNTVGYLPVTINEYTDPGVYDAYLYDETTYEYLGTYPVEISHAGAPPAEVGNVPNTLISFAHTYPAPGEYAVRWVDCCLGSPQIPASAPDEVPDPLRGVLDVVLWELYDFALGDVQAVIDDRWYGDVVPLFEGTIQQSSPFGVSGGNTTVTAL